MPRCAWFEDDRVFNCQEPSGNTLIKKFIGCETGCNPCLRDYTSLRTGLGTTEFVGHRQRYLRPHPLLESRDAAGRLAFRFNSFEPRRIPPNWYGLLASCHYDNDPAEVFDANEPDQRDREGEQENGICECQMRGDPCAGGYTGFGKGKIDTCNIYYGVRWPVTSRDRTMFCTGDPDGSPHPAVEPTRVGQAYEIKLISDNPRLLALSTVRTGRSECTSNFAVICWGQAERAGYCPGPTDPTLGGELPPDLLFNLWYNTANVFEFNFLRVGALTARFREDHYVDLATVGVKNAALAWLDRDIQKRSAGRIRLDQLDGHRSTSATNSNLPRFWRDYNLGHFEAFTSLPAMTVPTAGGGESTRIFDAYLRNSRCKLRDVEYVLLSADLQLHFVPYVRRRLHGPRYQDNQVQRTTWPIIRGRLTLEMSVRCDGLEGPCTFRQENLSVVNQPYGFPRVEPIGDDEIVYRDLQGRLVLCPPKHIVVDFDMGPFSEPAWQALRGSPHPFADDCVGVAQGLRNFLVPCVATNQHNVDACSVFTGGLRISAFESTRDKG